MRKIRLRLDDLSVESFGTAARTPKHTGTVRGHEITPATACFCTDDAGCYPSLYCSLQGPYQLTCAPDCMTNANGYC